MDQFSESVLPVTTIRTISGFVALVLRSNSSHSFLASAGGLSIVHGIIERHGGDIRVESRPAPAAFAFEYPNIERYAVKRVQPPYLEMAEKYRIEGVVVVKVDVASDGKVTQAEFVRGPIIFRSVSLDAAKRWPFKPPSNETLAGTIRFTFKLNTGG